MFRGRKSDADFNNGMCWSYLEHHQRHIPPWYEITTYRKLSEAEVRNLRT